MLKLGSVRIGADELRWMRWTEQKLLLSVRWEWKEVPVLLDLTGPVLLRWEHVDDERAGGFFYATGGTAQGNSERCCSAKCMVRLELIARPAAPGIQ